MEKYHALILAKSKSGRLEGKNSKDFHGKPMFLVNVEKCLKIFPEVYVTSDSKEILELAESAGAIPILRGEDLCGDTPNIPVYRHALKHMTPCAGFVAVQANSPTVDPNLIVWAKKALWLGAEEVMTCHADYSIYGSIWAMTVERLRSYGNPYAPTPDVLIVDNAIDIHTIEDYNKALCQ